MSDETTRTDGAQDEAQAPVEPQAQPESTPVTDESQFLITIDRRQLQAEIARLEREDREFANHLNTLVGRKAATKWQPEIQMREQEIRNLRTQMRRTEILAMPAEEIEQKFQQDPAFAREYAEVIHSQPQAPDELPIIARAFNEAIDTARSYGIPEETLNSYIAKAQRGEYDSNGQHWSVGLNALQRDLNEEVWKASQPKAAAPAPPPAPAVNPELAKGGPDLSHGQKPGATKITKESVKSASREQMMEWLDNPDTRAAVFAAQLASN